LSSKYGVVDLFAGPGGLGEGFASAGPRGENPFEIAISVEREKSAHRTLRLRAFIREVVRKSSRLPDSYVAFHAGRCAEPDWSKLDPDAWRLANAEARCLELGDEATATILDAEIDRLRSGGHTDTILIGGPPCQAYSLVGRARSRGTEGYRPEDDHRHFLFREYIHVLDRLRPAAFVLENVKGVLSSRVGDRQIFDEIMQDIATLGGSDDEAYELFALKVENGVLSLAKPEKPSDFIVRAEKHGIPQRRHRVIVIGVRSDLAPHATRARAAIDDTPCSVSEAIGKLPNLRSGLSKTADGTAEWKAAVLAAAGQLLGLYDDDEDMARELQKTIDEVADWHPAERTSSSLPEEYARSNRSLLQWLENDQLEALAQHETRGHMESDLMRYLFASVFGRVQKKCAKKADYPAALAPSHESWEKDIFSDRFRVQLGHEAATTITSHISKDGHYFIHPDPSQCRSLTVREAARLQTFPDDYLFLGNRTQQYVQVGNAVPPYLARQIADLLLKLLEGSAKYSENPTEALVDLVSA
jgi:DNA (cytosine-5)-methyltransferase 1